MKKPCRVCKQLIEASEWNQHQDAHKNAVRPDHWGGHAGRVNRQRALSRDRERCTVCSRTRVQLNLEGLQLQVHHINGDSHDHRVENLVSQCEECHERGGVPKRYRREDGA